MPYMENFWATYPTFLRARAAAVRRSAPATLSVPLVAGSSPQSMRKVVLFPAPFGPSRPKTCPFRTEKLTWLTAVKLPNRRTRSVTRMTTSPSAACSGSGFPSGTGTSSGAGSVCSASRVMKPSEKSGLPGCGWYSSSFCRVGWSGGRMMRTVPPWGVALMMPGMADSLLWNWRVLIFSGVCTVTHMPSARAMTSAGGASTSNRP